MSENLFAYTATNSGYSKGTAVLQELSMVNVLLRPLLCLL